MAMFEKRSAGTTHNDHDSHRDHDNRPGWDSHQRQAGVTAAQEVMFRWTGAFYDYAEQLLKAQRQFAHRLLGAGAPMRDGAQDVMSSNAHERRSGNPRETRSEGSTESWKNARSNDDTAKYDKRIDRDISGGSTSDTSRTERANTHTDESAKTRGRGAASAAPRLP